MFEIQQYRAGFTVARQVIQQLINVDIQAVTQRDKVRKAHFSLLCPVEYGIGYGGGLRDKSQLATLNRDGGKAGVKSLPGGEKPQAVGAQQAYVVA